MKKYQVFISSPFNNLQKERKIIIEAILRMGHIPIGMELFASSDSAPWEYIQPIIKESDYFIVLLKGNYGSKLSNEQISYTHKEYLCADKERVPILAFYHENFRILSDRDTNLEDLSNFIQQIKSSHLAQKWISSKDLVMKVVSSLNLSINTHPRCGWVREEKNLEKSQTLIDGIVYEYCNGNDWYEVYRKGKIRQGGVWAVTPNQLSVFTFLHPFKQNKYNIQVQNLSNKNITINIHSMSTTAIEVFIYTNQLISDKVLLSFIAEGF